jgi:hypothetical protein
MDGRQQSMDRDRDYERDRDRGSDRGSASGLFSSPHGRSSFGRPRSRDRLLFLLALLSPLFSVDTTTLKISVATLSNVRFSLSLPIWNS